MPIDQKDKERLVNIASHYNIHIHNHFENFSRNIKLSNVMVLDIENIQSLQAIMKTIYELNASKPNNQRILLRAAAGGDKKKYYSHSFSFTERSNAD